MSIGRGDSRIFGSRILGIRALGCIFRTLVSQPRLIMNGSSPRQSIKASVNCSSDSSVEPGTQVGDEVEGPVGPASRRGPGVRNSSDAKRISLVRSPCSSGAAQSNTATTPRSLQRSTENVRNGDHRVSTAAIDRGVLRTKRVVLLAFGRAALLSCLVSLPVCLLWLDVQWLGNTVGEFSVTELAQLALLAGTVLTLLRLAVRSGEDRRFAVLAAGFFVCMLIRESDSALDQLVDGLWQALVAFVATSCLVYGLLDWRSTLRGMARLVSSRIGLLMILGLAILLAYSRLFGMGALWQGLLEDQYLRVFKNAAEEGSELLGYFLIASASLGFVSARIRRIDRRASRRQGLSSANTTRPPRSAAKKRRPRATGSAASGPAVAKEMGPFEKSQ